MWSNILKKKERKTSLIHPFGPSGHEYALSVHSVPVCAEGFSSSDKRPEAINISGVECHGHIKLGEG